MSAEYSNLSLAEARDRIWVFLWQWGGYRCLPPGVRQCSLQANLTGPSPKAPGTFTQPQLWIMQITFVSVLNQRKPPSRFSWCPATSNCCILHFWLRFPHDYLYYRCCIVASLPSICKGDVLNFQVDPQGIKHFLEFEKPTENSETIVVA